MFQLSESHWRRGRQHAQSCGIMLKAQHSVSGIAPSTNSTTSPVVPTCLQGVKFPCARFCTHCCAGHRCPRRASAASQAAQRTEIGKYNAPSTRMVSYSRTMNTLTRSSCCCCRSYAGNALHTNKANIFSEGERVSISGNGKGGGTPLELVC